MRTIDADAFTEFLKDAIKQQKYEDTKIDGLLTVADVIEAVISELDGTSLVGFKNAPTIEPQPHWIPCSERLPEESGKYLITANDGIHKRTTVAKYQQRHKTWEMTGRMAYWKVLAWRPLPGPWKGEDNETD